MALSLGIGPDHDPPMFDQPHRSARARVRSDVPAPRSRVAEHLLIGLQRTAGNAAVAGLFGHPTVQRFWPFDDDEDEGEEEGPAAEEEVYKNPSEQIPNDPDDGWGPGWGTGIANWSGVAGPGYVVMSGQPEDPKNRDDVKVVALSAPMVVAASEKLPYEPIPEGVTQGGGGQLVMWGDRMMPPGTFSDTRDLVARQAMRYKSGAASPDIERIVNGQNGPGSGGPAGPGGRAPGPGGGGMAPGGQGGPTPGGGPAGPGGIPGMEPVSPGGGPAGPGGIPGMEPVSPGGGSTGPGGIPGLEPVSPGGGAAGPGGIPGLEPASPGGGPAGPTTSRPMLRKGSTGNAVREMQELLVRRGAAIDPDGDFGSRTQRAVIEFQRSKTLGADGIVGPLTWNALEAG